MMDNYARTLAKAGLGKAEGNKKYTDQLFDSLPTGIRLKGTVNYYADLPTDAQYGDVYIVKYAGESGEVVLGKEYVWTSQGGTDYWYERVTNTYFEELHIGEWSSFGDKTGILIAPDIISMSDDTKTIITFEAGSINIIKDIGEEEEIDLIINASGVNLNGVDKDWEEILAPNPLEEEWVFTLTDGTTVTKKVKVGE